MLSEVTRGDTIVTNGGLVVFSKWKITLILGALLLGFFFALPNALPADTRDKMPAMFQRTINLGLDLQGGAHMLLEVDLTSVLEQALENEKETIRQGFREADRLRTETIRVDSENSLLMSKASRRIKQPKLKNLVRRTFGSQLLKRTSLKFNSALLRNP